MRHIVTALSVLAAIAFRVVLGQTCDPTYVGYRGSLSTIEHQVRGSIEILSGCQFRATNFGYDGAAPAVYWRCSNSSSTADIRNGSRANNNRLATAYNGYGTITEQLLDGLDWSTNCRTLSLWCETFSALFGFVNLQPVMFPPPSMTAPPPPGQVTGGVTDAMADAMSNCIELLPGKMNMYWGLDDAVNPTSVTVTLQGVIDDGAWMAFGFNDPSFTMANMVGADIVVVGMVGGQAFAIDHFVSARSQCNYQSGQNNGVCPDTGYGGVNNAQLVAASRINNNGPAVTMVTFTRPLAPSGSTDWPWATATASPAVFATGPLETSSTAQLPAVLYHGPDSHSPKSFKFRFTADAGLMCPTPLGSSSGGPAAPPPPSVNVPMANLTFNNITYPSVPIMNGRTFIRVTLGNNPHHPNPPAWGVSYYLNGLESAILYVYVNTTYTFKVEAGESHPLYFTSDITGGHFDTSEVIYGGGDNAFGTAAAPYTFTWTVAPGTPPVIFYQCAVHRKLGWAIQVLESAPVGLQCSVSHPFVTFTGPLASTSKGVMGTVTVLDDCTARITGFAYDGTDTTAGVYAAQSTSANDVAAGVRLSLVLQRAYNEESMTLKLPPGASWDKYDTITVSSGGSSYGSVVLQAVQSMPPPAAPPPEPAPTGNGGPPVCGAKPHPFVGFMGALSELEHMVKGTVEIVDERTFIIRGFRYDGAAPATYIWGARSASQADLKAGFKLQDTKAPTCPQGGCDVGVTLPAGKTWDDIGAIAIWCSMFDANFGVVTLGVGSVNENPYLGFSGELMGIEHSVMGTVQVLSARTFMITNFRYDGTAPDPFIWAGKSTAYDDLKAGFALQDTNVQGCPAGGCTLTITLPANKTWADVGAIAVWCRTFKANFGAVMLTAGRGCVCPVKDHPYVGFKGSLSRLEHMVRGDVEILSGDSFVIRNFDYDGNAPAAYVWGAKDASLKNGFQLSDSTIDACYSGNCTINGMLPAGKTWDDVGAIGIWCKLFDANFGSVKLGPGPDCQGIPPTCSFQSSLGSLTYKACNDVPGTGTFYKLHYNLEQSPSGMALMRGALLVRTSGWAGWAIPRTPGQMVGSSAIIVRKTPSGVLADHYYLAEQDPSGVKPPSKLNFTNIKAGTVGSDYLVVTWDLLFSFTFAEAQTMPVNILSAVGTVTSSGDLEQHSPNSRVAGSINLATGVSSIKVDRKIPRLKTAHAWLMAVCWGCLIPFGIATAYGFKDFDPLWFHVHRACNIVGWLGGIAGFGIGIWLGNQDDIEYEAHRTIGIIVTVMGTLQVLFGIFRPHKWSNLRRAWNLLHWWNGRGATILAIVNIYEGFRILKPDEGFRIAYSTVLGCIIAYGLLKNWVSYVHQPPPESPPSSHTNSNSGKERDFSPQLSPYPKSESETGADKA